MGLLVAWTAWPRRYAPNLAAAEGEHVFNGYIKIATSGQVTVVVPEIETGQGSYTVFAQIMADELGADWRTIGIEPAPLNPLYADAAATSDWPKDLGDKLAEAVSTPPPQVTSEAFAPGSFEQRAREAGAAARALLSRAAGKRWGADWRACDTAGGRRRGARASDFFEKQGLARHDQGLWDTGHRGRFILPRGSGH